MFDPEYLQRLHLLGNLKMRNMAEEKKIFKSVITIEGKICPACNLYKKSEEYRRNARSKDGMVILCHKCRSAGKSVPASYYTNREKVAELKTKIAPNGLEGKLIVMNEELNDLTTKLTEYSQENAALRNKLKIIEHKEIISNLEEDKIKRRELLKELQ